MEATKDHHQHPFPQAIHVALYHLALNLQVHVTFRYRHVARNNRSVQKWLLKSEHLVLTVLSLEEEKTKLRIVLFYWLQIICDIRITANHILNTYQNHLEHGVQFVQGSVNYGIYVENRQV